MATGFGAGGSVIFSSANLASNEISDDGCPGLSFDQFDGKVYWDKSGASKGPALYDAETIGDMLWALVTGAEFQYIK